MNLGYAFYDGPENLSAGDSAIEKWQQQVGGCGSRVPRTLPSVYGDVNKEELKKDPGWGFQVFPAESRLP